MLSATAAVSVGLQIRTAIQDFALCRYILAVLRQPGSARHTISGQVSRPFSLLATPSRHRGVTSEFHTPVRNPGLSDRHSGVVARPRSLTLTRPIGKRHAWGRWTPFTHQLSLGATSRRSQRAISCVTTPKGRFSTSVVAFSTPVVALVAHETGLLLYLT